MKLLPLLSVAAFHAVALTLQISAATAAPEGAKAGDAAQNTGKIACATQGTKDTGKIACATQETQNTGRIACATQEKGGGGALNKLTAEEAAAGWQLLFNGTDTAEWRSVKSEKFPAKGWEVKDGLLTVLAKGKGGDIITRKVYSSFELTAEFNITAGANSGIKYFVQSGKGANPGIGLEYQVLDDAKHPDAKAGKNGNRTVASLYDLIPAAKDKPAVAPGSWHKARIVVRGSHVEHWLDGVKVVEFDRHSDAFRALVKGSKYKDFKKFGEWPTGHILLQDHNDRVSYRNIKILELPK